MGDAPLAQRASFKSMWESTRQDWKIITTHYERFTRVLPDRTLSHLKLLGGDSAGFAVDRLQHSLLTAALAQNGGETRSTWCARCSMLGSWNHPDVAAAILKPFVSEANHWMVEKHGISQGYHFFQHIGMERICDGGEIALKPAPGGIDDHRFFARQIEAQQSRARGPEPCEDRPHRYYDQRMLDRPPHNAGEHIGTRPTRPPRVIGIRARHDAPAAMPIDRIPSLV